MGIQTLPSSTIRAIGACQVLTDPATVIKELIDNSLDAGATSIAIEISANTVDVIQVRDNGHSILPEDRPLVAQRYCTSKIKSEDELRRIGGSSLGFRGEALASVAEMSRSLIISVRVDGEQVASALRIDAKGEIVGQERVSLPIGTTVRITDLFHANPVRRQVSLKHTEHTLKGIQHTLKTYAFARPRVRLSLKVIQSKNVNSHWMFAPKPTGDAEDVAFKIIGSSCASQCSWSIVDHAGFTFQAFLPRLDAQPDKIAKIGAFMSCDARPVSVKRGVFKQILKLYRDHLKRADSRFDGVKDPFVVVALHCPPESYDANIEPAKDDVLFENSQSVLDAAHRLFQAFYCANESPKVSDRHGDLPEMTPQHDNALHDFEQFGGVPLPTPYQSSAPDMPQSTSSPAMKGAGRATAITEYSQPQYRSSMYGCDEDDMLLLDALPSTHPPSTDFEDPSQALHDVTLSNPWTMAKLNSRVREPRSPLSTACPRISQNRTDSCIVDLTRTQPDEDCSSMLMYQMMPTPRPSSPITQAEQLQMRDAGPATQLASDLLVTGLDAPVPPQLNVPNMLHMTDEHNEASRPYKSLSSTADELSLLQASPALSIGTSLQSVPEASSSRRQTYGKLQARRPHALNRPFVPPTINKPRRERSWFDHLEGVERRDKRITRKRPSDRTDGLVTQGELGDLIEDPSPLSPPKRNRDIREYVGRSDIAAGIAEPFGKPPPSNQEEAYEISTASGPVLPDITATIPMISGRGGVPASEITALLKRSGAFDRRFHPISKRGKSSETMPLGEISGNAILRRKSSKNIRRTRSSGLQLETIPNGKEMQNVVNTVTVTIDDMREAARMVDQVYSHPSWSTSAADLSSVFASICDPSTVAAISTRLRKLLIDKLPDGEEAQNLHRLVTDALANHRHSMVYQRSIDQV